MAPIWTKSIEQQLSNHELVKKAVLWPSKITVRYVTGIVERYWFATKTAPIKHIAIDRSTGIIRHDIPISKLVENDLLTGESTYKYVAIGKKAWANATVLERRIALQRLISTIIEIGYQSKLPQSMLVNGLQYLRDDYAEHNDGPISFSNHISWPGKQVITHFIDVQDIDWSPRNILLKSMTNAYRINRIVSGMANGNIRLSSHYVMRKLTRHYGPYIASPRAYATLLKKLKVTSVYDPHPETGSKAMACALLGIKYYTKPNKLFDAGLERGFAGFIGLDHHYMTDDSDVDMTVVDFNMIKFDYTEALGLAKSRRLIVFVPSKYKAAAMDECRPEAIVDCVKQCGVDHFFLF